VAGLGDLFRGDEGFGFEVVRRLIGMPYPPGVEIAAFGSRGVHLAYRLMDGWDALIVVDTVHSGAPPGIVQVLVEPATVPSTGDDVFALLRRLDGVPARTVVVTCEPGSCGAGRRLSPAVREAVPYAARVVLGLLAEATV
jgi:hydrogenase maturation protease